MKYQDELPIKNDIMEITNLSESAIKMRLKRAKEKIVMLSKEVENKDD
jgi:RNA polymerase sigma-70 factor (ECF subfamily)